MFEIAYLSPEQVDLFQSDFRIVADYFVQKQKNGDYIPGTREIRHVQETLQLLSIMTGDHRFEEAYHNSKEGGSHTMCEVLDRIENKGREEGIKEGELKATREISLSLVSMGLPIETVAQAAHVSVELVEQWVNAEAAT